MARVWTLTTGEAGMGSQARGLALRLDTSFEDKIFPLGPPWSWMPGHLAPLALMLSGSHGLVPPWPDLLITCGRRSVAAALDMRRASKGRVRLVHIQNPRTPLRHFDLVIPMRHDQIEGPNVLSIATAVHPFTPEALERARAEWSMRLKPDNRPVLGVILGGPTGRMEMTDGVVEDVLAAIAAFRADTDGRVWVTPSRRTPAAVRARVQASLAADPMVQVWSGDGPNPYPGILAVCDRFLVTGESISMVSEALSAGRPVHAVWLPGLRGHHLEFLETLQEDGAISRLSGGTMDLSYIGTGPIDSCQPAVARVRQLLES